MVASIFISESAFYWPLLVLALQSLHVRRLFDNFKGMIDKTCGVLLIYLGLRVMLNRN